MIPSSWFWCYPVITILDFQEVKYQMETPSFKECYSLCYPIASSTRGPGTQKENLDGFLGFSLGLGPDIPAVSNWGVNQQTEKKSLCLSNKQTLKIKESGTVQVKLLPATSTSHRKYWFISWLLCF